MEENKKVQRDILPVEGIWNVQDFADYLGISAGQVQERLARMGVPVMHFSRMFRHRLFRIQDLKNKE